MRTGLQCTFTREGKRGAKADRHVVDLGKQMPTANTLTLSPGEEITEISVIVSGTQLPGVIGQLCIKTTMCPEGHKFGRTIDGEETALFTPEGMRLLSFHGRFVPRTQSASRHLKRFAAFKAPVYLHALSCDSLCLSLSLSL
jgi:hypothetical protein